MKHAVKRATTVQQFCSLAELFIKFDTTMEEPQIHPRNVGERCRLLAQEFESQLGRVDKKTDSVLYKKINDAAGRSRALETMSAKECTKGLTSPTPQLLAAYGNLLRSIAVMIQPTP